MPNQGNKSNGNSGIVKPKKNATAPSTLKKGTAGATKHNNKDGQKVVSASSGNGGSKKISGGGGSE